MAKFLYPDQFSDLDPEKDMKDFLISICLSNTQVFSQAVGSRRILLQSKFKSGLFEEYQVRKPI